MLSGFALKCYVCSGTEEMCSKSKLEGDKATYLKDCSSNLYDRCLRSWAEKDGVHTVANTCNNKGGCDLTTNLCNTMKDTIDGYECGVACCTEDECNAGSPVTFSLFLLIVSSVLSLALMK